MQVRKVAVLGAGNMGSGIAQACAQAGFRVSMRDVSDEAVRRGFSRIEGPLRKRVEQGKQKAEDVDALLARISGTTDVADAVRDADLVIEAVFEDLEVKRQVFAEVSKVAAPHAIFATNTSSLSVTALAKVTDRPEKVAGLHFFFPAAVNKLVEVVGGADTAPATVEALLDFSRRIGKVPIRTSDSAGFAVNRFFVPWLNESVRLLEEGVADVPTIEAAAKEAFQIGMGPFELMNVTGVPISLHAEETLWKAFGEYYRPAELLRKQVEAKANWDLAGVVDQSRLPAAKDRLLGVAFGIAARLVEEGVCSAVDADKGATIGLRWAAGPFAMMNAVGTKRALALVRKVNKQWGPAFPVAKDLVKLGAAGKPWRLPLVRAEVDGHVAVVTIDRPDALNALNEQVLRDLRDAFRGLGKDKRVRAVVLTGEGQKAFVAGADIKVMADKTPAAARVYTKLGQDVFREIETFPRPVIAAVNGVALGGGFELALACDLILASDRALFGLPEVTLGIHPGFGGTQRLPRLVGPMKAKELVFTAERFDAQKAKEWGVVLRVVPGPDLEREAKALAAKIGQMAPVAVALAKDAIDRGLEATVENGMRIELDNVVKTFATKDQKGAMKAFVEKRAFAFEGR